MTKTTKRLDGFKRGRTGVHPCDVCGRATRETNAVSVGSKLCPQCWDLAGYENEVQDGLVTLSTLRGGRVWELIAEVESKGGDASSWRATFSEDEAPAGAIEHDTTCPACSSIE